MLHPGIARVFAAGAVLSLVTAAAPYRAAAVETTIGTTAASRTTVRSGNHTDFGRIVVDTTDRTTYRVDQDGDRVVVRFDDDISLGPPPSTPRNVIGIKTNGPVVEVTLKHGTLLHVMRMAGHVVLDVSDPPDNAVPAAKNRAAETVPSTRIGTAPAPSMDVAAERPSATPGSRPPQRRLAGGPSTASSDPNDPAGPGIPPGTLKMASSPELGGRTTGRPAAAQPPMAGQRPPVEVQPLPPLSSAADSQPPPIQPTATDATATGVTATGATGQTPPGRDAMQEDAGPVGLRARRAKLPKEMDGSAFLVPFDSTTGAASFQSGNATYIAFDERRPVDMAALRNDPVFGGATVQLLASGTLFRLPLPQARFIALTQMPQGWRIAALTTAPKRLPIAAALAGGRLHLAAERPGAVISLADPETGSTLLVGTQHRPGQGVAMSRRSTEFILRPTIQGVVVEPLADSITLRPVPTGFSLAGGPTGLLLSSATSRADMLMDAAQLTRRLTLPAMATDVLLRRALKQLADTSASPPQARGAKNRAAAESLLALGFSAEAESLLRMAAERDPKEAASAETGALTAIAALLAGRIDEAGALADPRLDGTDEIALWRAVRQAMRDEGSPAAAAVFAATGALMFQYPKPIGERILPLMVETMIQGGEIAPAARLLTAYKDDPGVAPKLAYANALMRQAEGDTGQALTMLDTLATGHDQFDRARAAIRAVELRLAAGTLDKVKAADALDKLLYSWRGDARELALRTRVAELRGQTGAWRVALGTLRQAHTDFPEQAAATHERLKSLFAEMIRDKGTLKIPPIEFVSTVEENIDLIAASGDDDEPIEQSLADRLLALDLPNRAKPALEKLLRAAKSDEAKARFGVSLATLESREGRDAAVLAVLKASEGHDLPPDLIEQRAILLAESVARLGDPGAGAALLASLRTGRTTETRARILEGAADWTGAAQAWTDCVALTVPDNGPLDEAGGRTVLRLATATARAGDEAGLTGLRTKFDGRIGAGPLGDMFRVLTAEPIRTTADIVRSQREMSLAASVPNGLKALQASVAAR